MSQKLCKPYIPRLMALLLCLAVLMTCAPAARAEGGTCGDNLSWNYSGGVLTISGSGDMYHYASSAQVPWYGLRESITSLVLPAGMTSVGSHAFYNCTQLTSVDLPESVTSIGKYAFAGCRRMTMLDLGSSLESIGTGAFYSCRGIVSLRLPGTLKSIGSEAFYDCTGISSITLPESVTSIGSAAFAYCTGLIRAEINCSVTQLPEWAFFGCSQLSSVILPASVTSTGAAAFQECGNLTSISRGGQSVDKDSLEQTETRKPQNTGNSASSATGSQNPDGSVQIQSSTVVENDNSTVNSVLGYEQNQGQTTVSSNITVTVENDKGWQEAEDAVRDALENIPGGEDSGIVNDGNSVTVYVKDAGTIDQGFVDALAGKDVTVTFVSKDGSIWQIQGNDVSGSGAYDLRYTLTAGSEKLREELGVSECYVLTFQKSGQINAEVVIRLDAGLAWQSATLLQRGKDVKRIQTTVIDPEGYAHFYIASVDHETEYYIAINMPAPAGEEEQQAIVPENVLPAYGNAVNYQPIQYEITGRTSSWNMGLGKVMGILAAVMVGAVALVGFVMFQWNKRRLKNGYVPDWDDDDE